MPIYKTEKDSRHRELTSHFQRGKIGNGLGVWGLADRCKLLHLEWINNKVLMYIQYPVINHNGKEYLKKNAK